LIYKDFLKLARAVLYHWQNNNKNSKKKNISTLAKQKQNRREVANRFFWRGYAFPGLKPGNQAEKNKTTLR